MPNSGSFSHHERLSRSATTSPTTTTDGAPSDAAPEISFAGIVGNLWSFDGNFNTMMIQPMAFYNFPSMPGTYLGYNAVISADWEASSSNRWTVPLGLTLGRTFDLGGRGLDVGIGPYYNIASPDGGARWQLRFGINFLF